MSVLPARAMDLWTDAVHEWAERHGKRYSLTPTGPASGTWSHGRDGERIEMDAIEFCRAPSGRGVGEELLATQIPF